MHKDSDFSTSLLTLVVLGFFVCLFLFFNYSHPHGYEVISYCVFDLCFWLVLLNTLSCAYWPFVYLLWRNVYLSSLLIFKSGFVLLLSCRCSLYILDVIYLLGIWFADIFSHSLGCLFTLLVLPFDVVQLIYFFFCCLCFWCHIQESLTNQMSWRFSSMSSSKRFIVLVLMFGSLIHFELIFVYDGGKGLTLFFWRWFLCPLIRLQIFSPILRGVFSSCS